MEGQEILRSVELAGDNPVRPGREPRVLCHTLHLEVLRGWQYEVTRGGAGGTRVRDVDTGVPAELVTGHLLDEAGEIMVQPPAGTRHI